MNDLITPGLSQLPALPVEEVKQTVDKVGAYVDALAAAKKATTDQNTINEIDDQIRKYSAFKIRCQMELGKRTANIKPNTDFRGNQHSGKVQRSDLTKTEKLAELGISKQRASENERMNADSEIVEHYLKKAEEKKEIPTSSGALREIAMRKIPKKVTEQAKEEHEAFQNQKSVTVEDVRRDKINKSIIQGETGRRIRSELHRAASTLTTFNYLNSDEDYRMFVKYEGSDLPNIIRELTTARNSLDAIIGNLIEKGKQFGQDQRL